MAPFVSSREYSPASSVALFSSQDTGTAFTGASVDHLTTLEFGTDDLVMLSPIRNDLNDLRDLHSVLAGQLDKSCILLDTEGMPDERGHSCGSSTKLVITSTPPITVCVQFSAAVAL